MGYLDILQHLKSTVVDRHILSKFSNNWKMEGNVTCELSTEHVTINQNSLLIKTMAKDNYVYASLNDELTFPPKMDALRLDDRETIELHIYPTGTVADGDLQFILSESNDPAFATAALDITGLTANKLNLVKLPLVTGSGSTEDNKAKLLSNIRSIGLLATNDIACDIYVGGILAKSGKYIVTVEELNSKESEGEEYVLSKIPDETIPTPLLGAVSLAAAAFQWIKIRENERFQNDYGNQYTKNHGTKLLARARALCNDYLAGSDTESDGTTSTGPTPIDGRMLGGSSVNIRRAKGSGRTVIRESWR
jgi:hypothetical protein